MKFERTKQKLKFRAHPAGIEVEPLGEEEPGVHDGVDADEHGHLDGGPLAQPRPRHGVALGGR